MFFKNIKSLQMRLNDMKKALQQELRAPGQNPDNQEISNPVAVIDQPQSIHHQTFAQLQLSQGRG